MTKIKYIFLLLMLLLPLVTFGCMDNSLHIANDNLTRISVVSDEAWTLAIGTPGSVSYLTGNPGVSEFTLYLDNIETLEANVNLTVAYLASGQGYHFNLKANKKLCLL